MGAMMSNFYCRRCGKPVPRDIDLCYECNAELHPMPLEHRESWDDYYDMDSYDESDFEDYEDEDGYDESN